MAARRPRASGRHRGPGPRNAHRSRFPWRDPNPERLHAARSEPDVGPTFRGRSAISAGFALPRDAGQRPALRGDATTAAGQPHTVAFSQPDALANGQVDALAGDKILNSTLEAMWAGVLVVTAVDTVVDLGGFALDQDEEALLACLDDRLNYLTDERSIGFAEWLANPAVFQERAEAWTP